MNFWQASRGNRISVVNRMVKWQFNKLQFRETLFFMAGLYPRIHTVIVANVQKPSRHQIIAADYFSDAENDIAMPRHV